MLELVDRNSASLFVCLIYINRYAETGRQIPLRMEWYNNRASSNLVTYTWKIKNDII